ncbi:hypothetical protein, partial [Lysinibacillus sp. OL1]|uniref:hypothetical protein n=1 Tax=Lysinibacillus sp. OL1 TaxID=2517243 RepID=UPI001D11A59E
AFAQTKSCCCWRFAFAQTKPVVAGALLSHRQNLVVAGALLSHRQNLLLLALLHKLRKTKRNECEMNDERRIPVLALLELC